MSDYLRKIVMDANVRELNGPLRIATVDINNSYSRLIDSNHYGVELLGESVSGTQNYFMDKNTAINSTMSFQERVEPVENKQPVSAHKNNFHKKNTEDYFSSSEVNNLNEDDDANTEFNEVNLNSGKLDLSPSSEIDDTLRGPGAEQVERHDYKTENVDSNYRNKVDGNSINEELLNEVYSTHPVKILADVDKGSAEGKDSDSNSALLDESAQGNSHSFQSQIFKTQKNLSANQNRGIGDGGGNYKNEQSPTVDPLGKGYCTPLYESDSLADVYSKKMSSNANHNNIVQNKSKPEVFIGQVDIYIESSKVSEKVSSQLKENKNQASTLSAAYMRRL